MEKIIRVGDYEIPVRATAASLISYKANFGRDGLRDLLALSAAAQKSAGGLDGFDADVLYRFLWVFAKAANRDIPPLEEWLDDFDIPPLDFISGAMPQVVELLTITTKGSVNPKKAQAAAKKRK